MSLENLLPPTIVTTDYEQITLYRLGIYDNKMYELVHLNEGQVYPPHVHHHSTAELYFVEGEGMISLNGQERPYRKGEHITIKKEPVMNSTYKNKPYSSRFNHHQLLILKRAKLILNTFRRRSNETNIFLFP